MMNWLEVTIEASRQGLEVVTGVLLQLGITGFVVQDPDDFDEFLEGQGITWDYMDESVAKLKGTKRAITIYLADNMQGNETFLEIKNTLQKLKAGDKKNELGCLSLNLGNVSEDDWANNWKQYFKPFEVGKRFVIKPSWEAYNEKTNRIILEIDPNSSFGTGQHYTTQLCLEALEGYITHESQVLDMGCGSGILSIASLLLGAKKVTAVDIDQNSVDIAEENLLKNKMSSSQFNTYCGNILEDQKLIKQVAMIKYDLIVANIVADVIMMMKDFFASSLVSSGKLIASGIIGERAEEVKNALENSGFTVTAMTEKNDWVALVAQLKH